jgi:hypothetical protein
VAMESGPGMMSLFSGLGGAALSGFSAGMAQSNFKQKLMTGNPGDAD